MSDIHERIHVECPFERATSFLRVYLARHESANGRTATLPMRLSVSDIALERAVDVSLSPHLENPLGNILDVAWSPEDGGPYPSFAGQLAFHPDGVETCSMSLDGTYEPPGGVLGKAFDAAVGRRIALAGVRNLLAELQHEIEFSYRESVRDFESIQAPNYPPSYE